MKVFAFNIDGFAEPIDVDYTLPPVWEIPEREVNDKLSFNELKRLLNTTDGNLSVHARKLEEAGYVQCSKFFEGRTPRTEYKLAAAGRRALEAYLDRMEELIRTTRK